MFFPAFSQQRLFNDSQFFFPYNETAEEFNGQFTDVFNKNEHTQVPLVDRSAPFMNDIVISKEGVIKLLKGLNPSRALRPDELWNRNFMVT